MTVTRVKDGGECIDFFKEDWMVCHARIEICTSGEPADKITRAIMEEAHTGEVGECIVAILPVWQLYWIRTRAPGIPADL
jgi:nitrogen regulatory protein PII